MTAFDNLEMNLPRYYLGANSPGGFYSCFSEIYQPRQGDRLYILKGGPGTGKSTLMKKAAVALWPEHPAVLCYCSSDPNSLDAVIFPTLHAAIADGTAPHVMEAKYPGVSERLIPLGDCLNADLLEKESDRIFPLFEQNSALHARAARFIAAAGSLLDDNFTIACGYTDFDRATEFAERWAERLFPEKASAKGREIHRFLSGVTPLGSGYFDDTPARVCKKIYSINDEYGAVSSVILSTLRNKAINAGLDCIVCMCPMAPKRKIDHLIIPSLSVAFCTCTRMLPCHTVTERKIHARRFCDMAAMRREHRARLNFNRKASTDLLKGAAELIRGALSVHDQIEEYYISAMNFQKADLFCDQIISELKDLA